jgi:catechol 2,3-dioxygenase-like lactoylglutathione lyase family enzyme
LISGFPASPALAKFCYSRNPLEKTDQTMRVIDIDHLVLTVACIERTADFYERVLGMKHIVFGERRRSALMFGDRKINLHEAGAEFAPRAARPWTGSADLCFLVDDLEAVEAHLAACNVAVIEGPGPRSGARGAISSYYIRDPDGNLIELSQYV